MAWHDDDGVRWTEEALSGLEDRIAKVYREAWEDLDKTVRDYFDRFSERDKEQKARLERGEITGEYYRQWRLNQIGRGQRFEALRDQVASRMTRANETAISYANDATPGIYSLNRNYAAYTMEAVTGSSDFTLWDESAVRILIAETPDVMPYYPPERAVRRGIDLEYGKSQITKSVTSSILQGRSIKGIADDLQNRITGMNRTSAIRAARTAVTAAQNAGRLDAFHEAEQMGIRLKKVWLATLDDRTRHSHAALDGESQETDKEFSNGLLYPGDPNGAPEEVYNCRCTLISEVEGTEASHVQRRARDPETGESVVIADMTYSEWAGWKEAIGKGAGTENAGRPDKPEQVDTVDFSDKDAVLRRLEEAEHELEDLDYEVNYSITSDGKVWRVSGKAATVNPSAIPSSLKGSYSYHNHPAGKTNYSFSADDVAFFISQSEAYAKASDDLFEYEVWRTEETVEKTFDEVYHRFKEIVHTDIFRMEFSGDINADLDEYHEALKILCQELSFKYGRKKKNQ